MSVVEENPGGMSAVKLRNHVFLYLIFEKFLEFHFKGIISFPSVQTGKVLPAEFVERHKTQLCWHQWMVS